MTINPIELKKEMFTYKEELLSRFRDGEIDVQILTLALSDQVDTNIAKLADKFLGAFEDKVSLVFTGANGRQEVAPQSDLDVFILVEDDLFDGQRIPEDQKEFEVSFSAFYYSLMDAGFNISSVVPRSVEHCAEDVIADQETWTQILDRRKGWGSEDLYQRMNGRLAEIGEDHRKAFIQAKFDEYDERLNKQDKEDQSTLEDGVTGTGRFAVIEPNVKNGYGSLRGFQTAKWIEEEQCGVGGCDLAGRGIIEEEDEEAADDAHNFLLAVRCHLHDIAGREEDTLNSDTQPELASRMGYDGVVPFMKDYFGATRQIAHHAKMVCSDVAEQLGVKPPGASSGQHINFRSDDVSDAMQILELFKEHVESGHALHHTAMQKIRKSGDLITDDFIQDPQANRLMLDILSHEDAERTLRRMNTLDFLPRFVPELEEIRSLVQFDPYHAYTVDDHTLVAIGKITALANEQHEDLSPIASQIAQDLTQEDREILSVALLLHDVHKGAQPDDMKAFNRELVQKVGARLGLEGEALETAAWLTENYSLLKHTARYKDIEDSETIREFVSKVPDVKHLDLMRVMAMADTLAVGPGRLKAHAAYRADSVYEKAQKMMTGLTEQYNRSSFELPEDYEDGVPYVSIVPNPSVNADILTVITEDKPYLFENIMAALEKNHSNVLNARVSTVPNGNVRAANTFVIQNSAGGMHSERQVDSLRKAITEYTQRDDRVELEPISAKQDSARNPKNMVFAVEPRIEFSNALSDTNTIVEVTARNRKHLLHALTTVFNDMDMDLEHASITTRGHRAINVFQIHTRDGEQISPTAQIALRDALMEQIGEEDTLEVG